jgi:hypothetical protein
MAVGLFEAEHCPCRAFSLENQRQIGARRAFAGEEYGLKNEIRGIPA